MIWAKPRTSFGPNFSYGLGQTFSSIWKRFGPRLAPHLGQTPQHPASSNHIHIHLSHLGDHLTRTSATKATTGSTWGLGIAGAARPAHHQLNPTGATRVKEPMKATTSKEEA